MLVSKEEKEMLSKMDHDFKKMGSDLQNNLETITELLNFINKLVDELKVSNPVLALRIINKVSDIVNRRILPDNSMKENRRGGGGEEEGEGGGV